MTTQLFTTPAQATAPAGSNFDQGLRENTALGFDNIGLTVTDGDTERQILSNISFQVAAGEVVGLTGPSGSGKSTLLAIAGCLQQPTTGTAQILTTPGDIESAVTLQATGRKAAQLRRKHIGMVFQQPNLLPALTVEENLLVMRRLQRIWGWEGSGRKEAKQRAAELLEQVGLADYAKRRPAHLSGGQQARVNLARALMNQPQILLVDEPTAALDQETAAQVTDLIFEATRASNTATLYVTHDDKQLQNANRILKLVDGKLQ